MSKDHNACAEQHILRVQPRTQAFKDWDKQFSAAQIRTERARWLTPITVGEKLPESWILKVSQWPQDFVQACVYVMSDAESWQLFRVSLKGLSTQQKLYMLKVRYDTLVSPHAGKEESGESWMTYKIEKCRIDNYLGALIRGGQLNSNYEIVR